MLYGYVFCDPRRSRVVMLTKEGKVKYLSLHIKENINKAFCLRDISTMKVLYKALKENNDEGEMNIVDIQELYGKN